MMRKTTNKSRAKTKKHGLESYAKDISGWLLLLPSLICVLTLTVRPYILGTIWSFFDMKGYTVTDFVGFDNYRRVLADTRFLQTLGNTWVYVFWSLVIGLLIPFITAIVMNELLHFRKTLRVMVYMPAIMPAVAVSILWTLIYAPDASGLLNTFLSWFGIEPYVWLLDSRFTILYIIVSMTWSAMGGTAIYYFAALQGINRELYEAALVDGAGFFCRVRMVLFPQMAGMLLLFGVRQCIGVFNVVEQPMQMTGGGPNNASMSLGLLNYTYAFKDYKPQYSLALGMILLIILSVFTVIYHVLDKKLEDNQM